MVKSTIFQNFPNSPYILMIFTYENHCQAKKPECHLRIKSGQLLADLKFKSGHLTPL